MERRPLPKGWRWVKLEDVQAKNGRAIVSGPFGSNIGSRFFVEAGIPVIRGNNLTTDMTRFIDEGFVFITDQKAKELGNCEAITGDLIFTAAGSLGQVGIIPDNARFERYIISNKQLRARLDTDIIDSLYAFYWLSSPEMVRYIQQRNTGSTVPLINLSILRQLPIPLPPLDKQRAIASILGSLDDKIEMNSKMNQTLETMARAIFKSWFVDFDPVRAKMEGRKPNGMDDATAALFPDSFEESGLGLIPKGWKVSHLGEVCKINARSIGKTYPFDDIDYIDIASVTVGKLDTITRYKLAEAPSRAKRIVQDRDIIWSCVRPNRRSYLFIVDPAPNLVVSTGFCVLSPDSIGACYLYGWTTTDDFVEYLAVNADGSAYPAVTSDHFARAEVLLPPTDVLKDFESLVWPLRRAIHTNDQQSRILAEAREALLPKLMSGEICVKGWKATK